MRRLQGLLLTVALGFLLLLVPAAANAAETGPPAGPEPAGPNDPDNEFAPEDIDAGYQYDQWAKGFFALTVVGALGLGAAYYVKIVRPSQQVDA